MTDTWRQDHLGFYGNKKVRTPNLNRFSKRCVVFDRCYEGSFPTMPTRADIFTGKWTYATSKWGPLPKDEIVLAQILQREKYLTGSVVDVPFFNVSGIQETFNKGFSDFTLIKGQGRDRRDFNFQRQYESDYCAPNTMITASRWLECHYRENFFLYVDTWDPHEPWDPPQGYGEYYYPGYDGKPPTSVPYWFYKEVGLTEEDVKKAHALYCGEITMVDRWVGHLLDSIESMNLMDETAIIFTSDHGFYFGEHGMLGKTLHHRRGPDKGRYRSPLYEEITRVPLLIYFPGAKARRIDDLVSLPDLMPTISELMGVEIPKSVQGQSLVPLLMGEDQKRQDFAVTSPGLQNLGEITREVDNRAREMKEWHLTTITTREWSLLYAAEGQPAELYNLSSDPKQEKNLIKEEPEVAQELLNKFVRQMEESGTEPRLLDRRRHF